MVGFVTFFHAVVCVLVVAIVLMQSGRGGGLTESFSSAESMFGTQTNSFLIKTTTILTAFFFVTCLSLAVMSTKESRSLMTTATVEKSVDAAAKKTMPITVTDTPMAPIEEKTTQP